MNCRVVCIHQPNAEDIFQVVFGIGHDTVVACHLIGGSSASTTMDSAAAVPPNLIIPTAGGRYSVAAENGFDKAKPSIVEAASLPLARGWKPLPL